MMSDAKITDKSQHPPGVMPRNLQGILMAVIASLILISSYCSTIRSQRSSGSSAANTGAVNTPIADPKRLEVVRRQLEETKRLADAEQARLAALRAQKKSEVVPETAPVYAAPPPPKPVDPLEQERKRREAMAPFATSVVYSKGAERSTSSGKEGARQHAAHAPSAQAQDLPHPGTAKAREAGSILPAREGDLYRLYEGTMIDAVLTNRLDGTFSGPVNCMISVPVHSPLNRAVIIPAGSRVFGETKKVDYFGQQRLTVTFHRLLLPNDYSVDLDELPGLNQVGETGLRDKVDNHYLRVFGVSAMLGLLGGLSLHSTHAGFDQSGADLYRQGVATSIGNSATRILDRFLNVLPTVTIREGHAMKIYLTRDLLLPEYRPRREL